MKVDTCCIYVLKVQAQGTNTFASVSENQTTFSQCIKRAQFQNYSFAGNGVGYDEMGLHLSLKAFLSSCALCAISVSWKCMPSCPGLSGVWLFAVQLLCLLDLRLRQIFKNGASALVSSVTQELVQVQTHKTSIKAKNALVWAEGFVVMFSLRRSSELLVGQQLHTSSCWG